MNCINLFQKKYIKTFLVIFLYSSFFVSADAENLIEQTPTVDGYSMQGVSANIVSGVVIDQSGVDASGVPLGYSATTDLMTVSGYLTSTDGQYSLATSPAVGNIAIIDTTFQASTGNSGGGGGNPINILIAQKLLNQIGYSVNQIGVIDENFQRVIKRFQKDNKLPITGNLDITTYTKIKYQAKNNPILYENSTVKDDILCLPFTKNLKKGSRGNQVKKLQRFLTKQGFPVDITGYFGDVTYGAVTLFQARYSSEILIFNSIALKPTGFWGEMSRKKANQLLNCKAQQKKIINTTKDVKQIPLTVESIKNATPSLEWSTVDIKTGIKKSISNL